VTSLLLDPVEPRLLGLLQTEFPFVREPFAELGLKLEMSGAEVIQRIQGLKSRGIVRQISPILDARKLGYQSTLVAMQVPQSNLKRAEDVIRKHPGVSHAYLRAHEYNLWITLAIPQNADIRAELEKLKAEIEAEIIFDLPALKVFKLRAYFGSEDDDTSADPQHQAIAEMVELSDRERLILNGLQQDLPLTSNPFDSLAGSAGMDVGEFLEDCRVLLEKGVIRRYGAAVNHRSTGFQANAMVCWEASPERAEAMGQNLARQKAVSHCYVRRTNSNWPYNLFAMIHGHTPAECEAVVKEVEENDGLTGRLFLYSTREIKKTRILYRV
jgi:DNA-binding Lrp family transcriptional regulator